MPVLIVYAYLYVCAYKQMHTYDFFQTQKTEEKILKGVVDLVLILF